MYHKVVLILGFLWLGSEAEVIIPSKMQEVSSRMKEFMRGFFTYYQLPFPSQIISCYNEKGIKTFFDLLQVSYQLGQDLLEGDTELYRSMIETFEELYEDVTPFYLCQWQTDDWKGFLMQINPNFTISDHEAIYLQFMSKFMKLYTEGQLVEWSILLDHTQKEIKIGDFFKAGFEYASAHNKSGFFLNDTMLEYLKLEAFDMGFIIAMGFAYEDSSIFCYSQDTAEHSIEWFYRLAKTITDADIDNITNTTEDFFKSTSKQVKGQLPDHVEVCLASVPGTKKFQEKFGLDPQVPVFPYALTYFSKKRPEPYYNSMTYIWERFDDWDYLNAGIAFGDLLKRVLSEYSYRAR